MIAPLRSVLGSGFDKVLARAAAAGLFPEGVNAQGNDENDRPWPVIILSALGAVLTTIPLLAFLFLFLDSFFKDILTTLTLGTIGVLGSAWALKKKTLSLFKEQLTVITLICGCFLLGISFRDVWIEWPHLISLGVAVVMLVLAAYIGRGWLTVIAGLIAALALGISIQGHDDWAIFYLHHSDQTNDDLLMRLSSMLGLLIPLLLWLTAIYYQQKTRANLQKAKGNQFIEFAASGWLIALLLGFGTHVDTYALAIAERGTVNGSTPMSGGWPLEWPIVSVSFSVLAMFLLFSNMPSLRSPLKLLVFLPLIVLAWFQPNLGFAFFTLAVCLCTHRYSLTTACVVCVLWLISMFYFQLNWSLIDKANMLAGVGLTMGLVAWLASKQAVSTARLSAPAPLNDSGINTQASMPLWSRALILLTLAATLLLINFSIKQKENIIANGKPVLIALAPVDPRSLMQGDYMALRFNLPTDSSNLDGKSFIGGTRPAVIGKIDAKGVAELTRTVLPDEPRSSLTADEILIELTPKNSLWTVVTDAWFFKEGDGPRFAKAKYGEFRVQPDGKALLVGLRDADLNVIAK